MQKGVLRKRKPRPLSEYGRQLREKQELKEQYNLRERQFAKYIKKVLSKAKGAESSPELLMRELETRLDNVVYRMGLAQTRNQSRQMVSHGHFLVNGRPSDIPSYHVKIGDVIAIHPSSLSTVLFSNAQKALKKYEAPTWLELDKEKLEAKIVSEPSLKEVAPNVELSLIFEFYSR